MFYGDGAGGSVKLLRHDLVIEEHVTAAGRLVYVATCLTCKTWGPTQEERSDAEADLEWLPKVACRS